MNRVIGAVVFPSCFANTEHPMRCGSLTQLQPGLLCEPQGPVQPEQGYGQIFSEMFLYEQLIKGIMLFLPHLICFLLPSSF